MELYNFIKKYKNELNNNICGFFNLALSYLGVNQVEELVRMLKKANLPISWDQVFSDASNYLLFTDTIKKPWRFQVEEWFEKLESPIIFPTGVESNKLLNNLLEDPHFSFHSNQKLSNLPSYIKDIDIMPFYHIINNQILLTWLIRLYNRQNDPGKSFYLRWVGLEDINYRIDETYYKIIPELGIGYDMYRIQNLIQQVRDYIIECAK